ncbi:MAG TPA: SMC-Scp complex subunit ScpB [Terriglobia bacterium]|nr:SMC-Scp complex subunit ScpB [Terriglobia bacterium]
MLTDETLQALIEAILYVAPEPVTIEVIAKALEGEERERVKRKLEELVQDFERADHGIQIRQVAGGYKFSSKAEHHEVVRKFVKSLKPPLRLSKQALETLAVIAYRQPVTVPEIQEIRGVDCGGVIHTLMEKKLVVTAGRKSVVGRPILYRTTRDFLVHFGLKDTSELPSLREFEELARQALGPELALSEQPAAAAEPTPAESAGTPAEASEAGPPIPSEIASHRPPAEAASSVPESGPGDAPAESAAVESPAPDGVAQAERKP